MITINQIRVIEESTRLRNIHMQWFHDGNLYGFKIYHICEPDPFVERLTQKLKITYGYGEVLPYRNQYKCETCGAKPEIEVAEWFRNNLYG